MSAAGMKFFIPDTPNAQAESVYAELIKATHDQLRLNIKPKRIAYLKYVHGKQTITLRVGMYHPDHPGYKILAIFESNPHIVVTRSSTGKSGLTIMVANTEITELTEFDY